MAGMGKQAAKALIDSGRITWDDLRGMLERTDEDELRKTSRVNRQISKHVSHSVCVGAVAGRTGKVEAWRPYPYARRGGGMKRTTGGMIAVNVLRDFGTPLAPDTDSGADDAT